MSEETKPDGGEAPKPAEASRAPFVAMAVALAIALGLVLYLRRAPSASKAPAAAGDLPAALERLGHTKAAAAVRSACSAGASCECNQARATAALDANLADRALAALSADASCQSQPKSRGMEAEALARAGKSDEAIAKAKELLAADPKNAFASYALAQASYAKGDMGTTLSAAEAAIRDGRAAPAELLLGLIAYRAKDFAAAKTHFENILKLDPDDVDALYNLALLAQTQNHYRDAREGYLHVLRLAPSNLDARYNLVVLTHSVGANAEARHHLGELDRAAPPGDERVRKAKALLEQPAPAQPGVVPAPSR